MSKFTVKIRDEKMDDFRFLSEDNENFVEELLKKFVEYLPTLIAQADESLAKKDFAHLSVVLHTIKGSIVSLGLEPADEYISAAYEKIRKGDYSSAVEIVKNIKEYYEAGKEYYLASFKK